VVSGSNGAISSLTESKMVTQDDGGLRVEFLGSADRIALFRVGPNSVGMWEKIMREE